MRPDGPKTVLEILRCFLFIGVGLALPLFAFPVFKLFGHPIDLATLLAATFVLASVPGLLSTPTPKGLWLLVIGAIGVPLLILVPPRSTRFGPGQFAASYLHWLLVVFFFVSASRLTPSERNRQRLVAANVIVGAAVALFALYQVFGIPRGWAGTGTMLVPFQREPFRMTDIGTGYVRPSSLFLEPAWMGGYLAWVLVLAIALVAAWQRRRQQVLGLAGVVLTLLAIVASVSWGAYVDTAAGLTVSVIVLLWSRGFSARGILVAAGLLFLVVVLAGVSPPGRRVIAAAESRYGLLLQTPVAPERMAPEVDSSWVRFRNLAHTAALFRSRVKRGIGLGQFANYASGPGGEALRFRDPWCGWIAVGAEMGVLGPALLIGAMGFALRRRLSSMTADAFGAVSPVLLFVCAIQQLHTASYIDLWFWYPLSLALVLAAPPESPSPNG